MYVGTVTYVYTVTYVATVAYVTTVTYAGTTCNSTSTVHHAYRFVIFVATKTAKMTSCRKC